MSKTQDSDYNLVKLSQKGDLKAFEMLVKKYQDALYRKAKSILSDEERAKDVTQDAFVKAYKNIWRFDTKMPFKPWIYKIMINTAYDIIKKDKRLVTLTDNIQVIEESTLEKMIRLEEIKKLLLALSKLPKMYEKPLREFYMNNLSYATIATNMNLPINTIRTRIYRGKYYLKKELL